MSGTFNRRTATATTIAAAVKVGGAAGKPIDSTRLPAISERRVHGRTTLKMTRDGISNVKDDKGSRNRGLNVCLAPRSGFACGGFKYGPRRTDWEKAARLAIQKTAKRSRMALGSARSGNEGAYSNGTPKE